jgi:hypothetical protein
MGVYSRIHRSPNVEGWSAAVAIGVAGAAVGALLGFARRGTMLPALAR